MAIEDPYGELKGGNWIQGNLHAHTTRSDGKWPMQAVIDDYAARGHGFLVISDHDIYTGPDEYAAFDARGLVLIPGNEITTGGPHMLHVNPTRRVEPHADRQQAINQAVADRGFIVLNHPNWQQQFDHFPLSLMQSLTGYTGIEIYNGVIGRLDGSPYALDKWDMLLSAGQRTWGFANDDSHAPPADCGLGWNCAYVQGNGVDEIVAALVAGRFYASTGVVIEDIAVSGHRIRIRTANAERIVAIGRYAKRLACVDSREIVFDVPDDAQYVRFECWGRGESFAWTQPFFVTP